MVTNFFTDIAFFTLFVIMVKESERKEMQLWRDIL